MRCDGIQVVPPNQNFKTKVVNALSNPPNKETAEVFSFK
jgi:hypothetical protein